jgi:hydroxymethylglutaryl-CoA reductase
MNLSGFYKLSLKERQAKVKEMTGLTDDEMDSLEKGLELNTAEYMIENVIGVAGLPFGVATNFVINGKEYLIPMVLEEPSVVAGASLGAKLSSGFVAEAKEPIMIGQVQIVRALKSAQEILERKQEIIELANSKDPVLVKFGGGCRDVEAKEISTDAGKMIIVHLLVDVRDAMGANAVNTMAEAVAPLLEQITGGKVRLRIISNLAVHRMFKAKTMWKKDVIGEETVNGIIEAYEFAKNDMYRCATHNKGIMNGVDALTIATGNDFRAIEAGAHSYAALNGYKPLTRYSKDSNGNLVGEIELPLAYGTVGGATKTLKSAQIALKILGNPNAQELGQIGAALGLAQNFAALRALAITGIQAGHMRLHARNVAINAGVAKDKIDEVVKRMVEQKTISVDKARDIAETL